MIDILVARIRELTHELELELAKQKKAVEYLEFGLKLLQECKRPVICQTHQPGECDGTRSTCRRSTIPWP